MRYEAFSVGDVLRAAPSGLNWVIESNGTSGSVTTAGAGNAQGPGGGEYYYQDNYARYGTAYLNYHQQTGIGGAAQIAGFPNVLGTEFDPVPIGDASTTYDSGISWFNNGTGASDKSYRIYDGSAVTSDPSLGKNAGLGDLEVLCNAAPIEFGNRVWDDQNGNGIQDPGEAGISGVTVRLYTPGGPDGSIGTVGDNATAIAVTVTNANGEYYFRVVDADNNGYPDGQPGLV